MERTKLADDSHHPQHHPHPVQQGLPPPQHLQHPSARGVVQQQHHPGSPHQPGHQNQSPGPYASPHSTSHGLPSQGPPQPQHPQQQQHQGQYGGIHPGPSGQHPQAVQYFPQAHQSPYSAHSTAGAYSSPDNPELMATATMNRQYPAPIYHTPQSASPASVQSPQHDQHGRPMYPQQMYYPQQYQVQPQHSPYTQHPGPHQPAPLTTNFMSQPPGQPQSYHTSHPVTPALTGSPGSKLQGQQLQGGGQLQRQGTQMSPVSATPTGPPGSAGTPHQGPQSSPSVNPNAAPGPIPATTPLVVRQDQNGVQWIAFEYSRDRVKMEYTIRCDVESVDVNTLSQEFKTENCVYPRACCAKDQYKGNRLHYETECNTVGWALAQLNPCLRGKRGLIQRAVDSWRNSNQDPRLRSRRVRRMAKISNRKAVQAQQHPGAAPPHMAAPGAPGGPPPPPPQQQQQQQQQPPPMQSSASMGGAPGQPGPPLGMGGPQGQYQPHQAHHQPQHAPHARQDVRTSHNFYPTYPTPASAGLVSQLPPSQNPMDHAGAGQHAVPHSATPSRPSAAANGSNHNGSSRAAGGSDDDYEEGSALALFGDLPEAKRRKFILVDDAQRGTRVRVRVMLDQVRMAEMPDSYRRGNSVFPRSWFATEMQDSDGPGPRGRWPDDVLDGEAAEDDEERVRTWVPLPVTDGGEATGGATTMAAVPRMTRARRKKEVTLNDLGYRMSWSQSRVFSGRTLFLQRSYAYRNKMRSTMQAAGQDVPATAPHFETRAGKRKWLERSGARTGGGAGGKGGAREGSP